MTITITTTSSINNATTTTTTNNNNNNLAYIYVMFTNSIRSYMHITYGY